jgi:hypothetical protein
MKIYRNLISLAAVSAALTIAGQARATPIPIDTTSFFLNQPECTGTCGPGSVPSLIPNSSAVNVTINLFTSTFASAIFTNPTAGNITDPVELNIAGGNFIATSNIPLAGGTGVGTTCGLGTGNTGSGTCAPGSDDHFGTMSLETSAVGAHTITINLTADNGVTWANAAAVLAFTTNFASVYGHGFEAEVHVGSNGVQDGGFATPLPAALPLFVSGIGGLGLLGWRRKRKAQAVA